MTQRIAEPQTLVPRGEGFLLLSPTAQAFAYRNVIACLPRALSGAATE